MLQYVNKTFNNVNPDKENFALSENLELFFGRKFFLLLTKAL